MEDNNYVAFKAGDITHLKGPHIFQAGPIRRRTTAGNPIFRWQMREPRKVLPLLIPHLTVKRHKAELILAHTSTFSLSHSKGIPPEVLAERRRIETEFAALKGLGRGGQ